MQKQLEGTQKYINEQVGQRLSPYRWATHAIIVSNTHALPASINAQSKETSNQLTNVCWVSVLTTFSALPQILSPTVSSPNSRNEENDG